ncbi:MAG: hypothetical protein Q9169_006031 [Polycauliona sp. 2 TL-2023]
MQFPAVKARRVIEACVIVTIPVLVLVSFKFHTVDDRSVAGIDNRRVAVQDVIPDLVKRVAVPFGHRSVPSPLARSSYLSERKGNATLSERADPDTLTLEQAIANGNKYLGIISAAQPKPPVWTQNDFDVGGWKDNPDNLPQTVEQNLQEPLQDLGVSFNEADLRKTAAQQFTGFENMDCEQIDDDQSGGQYIMTYFPNGGTMITNEVISPVQNAKNYYSQMNMPPPTVPELRKMIPRLNRWSDIVWFLWAKKAGDQAGDLRYIFKDNVVNQGTRAVIDQVFKIPPNTLDLKWPGKTFDVRTGNEGKALLGTPLGNGIAWILADNKQVLGDRSLKITCFTNDAFFQGKTKYFMVFELVRV